jgi:hypothetical protein
MINLITELAIHDLVCEHSYRCLDLKSLLSGNFRNLPNRMASRKELAPTAVESALMDGKQSFNNIAIN